MNHLGDYDVIVIGAGHAGIEAAHAAATPSRVLVGYKGFVGHYIYTNCLVTVDAGATLVLDGTLRDGS